MNNKWFILGITVLVLAFIGFALFPMFTFAQGGPWGSGWGWGMMGGYGYGGMMGGFYNAPANGPRLSLEEAEAVAREFAASYPADRPLEVLEVMEFEHNFYAQIVEADTGIGAFEILIDPVTGAVRPEPGPNMMWNTRYGMHTNGNGWGWMMGGMMGGGWDAVSDAAEEMPISPEEAIALARDYVRQVRPGLEVGDEAVPFYGYYTLHTLDDSGEITGMFSVNGYTGQIWFHDWHGDYLGMTAEEHD
jgi:hypothetical protein